jgi:branched-chain amino acid transport system substrate-binding protein
MSYKSLRRMLTGIALLSIGCSSALDAQTLAPIVIGAHLDVAKQASYYSLLQKSGIEAFVRWKNANGGVNGHPIRLAFEDDENDPNVAAQKVQKLAGEGASIILSISSSATGVAAQAAAEELKIPIASANQAEKLTTSPPKRYYFRIGVRDSVAGDGLARYIKAKNPNAKVAIVRDSTESGLLISDDYIGQLKNAGINVVDVEQITPGSVDVTAQALKVRGAAPDFVLLAGASTPDLANYIKMHANMHNPAPLLGSTLFGTPSFATLVGPAGEGFIFPSNVDLARPEVKQVEDLLAAQMGDKVRGDWTLVQTWELMRLITSAMERGGSTREGLRNALEATKNWPTALGSPGTMVNFSPQNHDVFTRGDQIVLMELHDGKYINTASVPKR